MNWTTHEPKFDGDAPDGVTLDTHEVEWHNDNRIWRKFYSKSIAWMAGDTYRYRITIPTYEQVKAWHIANGLPVPPKPVDYEAWENVLQAHYDAYEGGVVATPPDIEDRKNIDSLIAAMRVAVNSPACMEAIND